MQQSREVIIESTIMVLQILLTVINAHRDQLFPE